MTENINKEDQSTKKPTAIRIGHHAVMELKAPVTVVTASVTVLAVIDYPPFFSRFNINSFTKYALD